MVVAARWWILSSCCNSPMNLLASFCCSPSNWKGGKAFVIAVPVAILLAANLPFLHAPVAHFIGLAFALDVHRERRAPVAVGPCVHKHLV